MRLLLLARTLLLFIGATVTARGPGCVLAQSTAQQAVAPDTGTKPFVELRIARISGGKIGLNLPVSSGPGATAQTKEIASMDASSPYVISFAGGIEHVGPSVVGSIGLGVQLMPSEKGKTATSEVKEMTADAALRLGYMVAPLLQPYAALRVGVSLLSPTGQTTLNFTNSTGPTSRAVVESSKAGLHAAVGMGAALHLTRAMAGLIEVAYDVRGNYGLTAPPNLEGTSLMLSGLSLTVGTRYRIGQ